jgi:hypothetical protein
LKKRPTLHSIETYGQLALSYLRSGRMKSLDAANKALESSANIPHGLPMNIGYTAIADVYFDLWERSLQNPTSSLIR